MSAKSPERLDPNRLVTVSIAVCTFRRQASLANLLSDIDRLVFSNLIGVRPKVVVIDNDSDRSAERTVKQAAGNMKIPVEYFCEPERGLSAVRNAALEKSLGSDFVAFVDDDESIGEHWLEALLIHALDDSIYFVIGPVRPVFPETCPDYLISSGLYHRKEFSDGAQILTGNTGNALLRVSALQRHAIRFRTQFNQSGGEDTCFFGELVAAGGCGVFAANAVAYEPVPEERLSVAWLIRRRCRFGATEVIERGVRGCLPWAASFSYFVRGVVRIGVCAVLAAAFAAVNRGRALHYACASARGVGYVFGVFGKNIREYH